MSISVEKRISIIIASDEGDFDKIDEIIEIIKDNEKFEYDYDIENNGDYLELLIDSNDLKEFERLEKLF